MDLTKAEAKPLSVGDFFRSRIRRAHDVAALLTEDPKAELRRERLLRFRRNPLAMLFSVFGLYWSLVNVLTAISAGTVDYAGRTSKYTGPITFQQSPRDFVTILVVAIFGIPLWGMALYVYFFKKVPDTKSRVGKECCGMKMEQPSRRLMIASTVVTGLFIVVGFMIAFYATEHSPNVDIPIYKDGIVVRTQDKGEALIAPLLVQFLFFLVMVYHCLIWDRFVRKASERTAAANAQYSMRVDLARGLRLVCYGTIGMDVFIFSIVAFHAIQLLKL